MKTKCIYLDDSYEKTYSARVLEIKTNKELTSVVLDQTVFYPVGGGQPSDHGVIQGKKGKLVVEQVIIRGEAIEHIGKLEGKLKLKEIVNCTLDWERRYHNMRVHSAGHVLHEAVKHLFPELTPIEGEHGRRSYLRYSGNLDEISQNLILNKANDLVNENLPILTEFVTLDELKKRSPWIPEHLPTNKPLRIMWIGNFPPIPDGGTQVKNTSEILNFNYLQISNEGNEVTVLYRISDLQPKSSKNDKQTQTIFSSYQTISILDLKNQAYAQIDEAKDQEELVKTESLH